MSDDERREEEQVDDEGGLGNPGVTEVAKWLVDNQLEMYVDVCRAEGYDDLEDLKAVVVDGAGLEKIIGKGGHRRKIMRLLGEAPASPSPSSISRGPSQGSTRSASPQNQEIGRFKVIVVGDAGTGKTSYIQQLVHSRFSPNTKATIGLDWREKQFKVKGGFVTVQFWDISGQERFANVTRAYYQGAHGAIVCFDRSSAKSLLTVEKWKEDIDSKVFIGGGSDGTAIPCLLLANKCDLEDKSNFTLEEITKRHEFEGSFETSAKLNYNIQPSIDFLIGAMERHQNAILSDPAAQQPPQQVVPVQTITQHLPSPSESTTTVGKKKREPQRKKKLCSSM